MYDAPLSAAFEATVILSTAATLAIGATLARRPTPLTHSSDPPRAVPGSLFARSLLFHPLTQFLLVCAVLYVNQVLFGAFILRAHGGSTTFISRFIPGSWFAIGTHDPLVQLASHHVGDGRWLSPTLLRVQAFLELPFTMFAYLAVARLLGRRLYATLTALPVLALACLSFSVTFSWVELALTNPYTHDDLVLRATACLVTPVYIAWIARCEARRSPVEDTGPSGVLGLMAFLAGAGALSYIVLALYDAFLLYNLAHLPRYASGIAVSLVVAAACSFVAPRIDSAVARAIGSTSPSPGIDVLVSTLRAFTILFFVPSLSLRYWGYHPSAVLCGLLVVLLGFVGGTAAALQRSKPGPGVILRMALAGSAGLFAGGWAAHLAMVTAGHGLPELLLARVALSFLAVAIVAFRIVEIFVCWPLHETKAQADQA